MARATDGASHVPVDLPHPAIRIERVLDTIDSSMPGGHAVVDDRESAGARPTRCWASRRGLHLRAGAARAGAAVALHALARRRQRAHEIATDYAVTREAFGKPLIDHEGVGFMLADNLIDLQQAELMIDWCADVLDGGALGTTESSMAKVAVSEALFRVADRCVQVMGGTGVSRDTIVEQVFREISRLPHLRRPDRGAQMVARQEDQARGAARLFAAARLNATIRDGNSA